MCGRTPWVSLALASLTSCAAAAHAQGTVHAHAPEAIDSTRSLATPHITWLQPSLRLVYNGALATSANEGTLWTGRGINVLTRAGVEMVAGRWSLVVAPELAYSENRPVDITVLPPPGMSGWSSPWRAPQAPADLPLRFGSAPILAIAPGQSTLSARWDHIAVGFTSANCWWGPGLRNALVSSNNAPGFPHAFVRTPRALETRWGAVTAEWIAGALTESPFFDTISVNDRRAVSGITASLALRGLPGLTLGLSRLTVAPITTLGGVATHAADALSAWRTRDSVDQMTALFANWEFPEDGAAVWTELAKQRTPSTLREMLIAPNADLGWTVGAEWRSSPRNTAPHTGTSVDVAPSSWRVQMEISEVGQSQVFASRAPQDWGTGTAAVQGFTQRGRMLGISTGPGSSSWWVALDRMVTSRQRPWHVGGFASRVRWENDAYYRQPHTSFFGHDVSLAAGIRAGVETSAWEMRALVGLERRFNYQFNNSWLVPLHRGQQNVNNLRMEWDIMPRGGVRRVGPRER